MKKLNLKSLGEKLSRDQMKMVVGGYNGAKCCGSNNYGGTVVFECSSCVPVDAGYHGVCSAGAVVGCNV